MANVTSSVYIFLGVDISMLILGILSFVGNGVVFVFIFIRPSLRKNESLFLIAALSFADCVLGILLMPYIIYLIANWSEDINYSAAVILPLNTPTVSEIKVSSIVTLAIALDRLIALQWPVYYRYRNKKAYAIGSLSFGVIWGMIDGILLFVMSEFKPNPGCAAAGCFFGDNFRYYWGVSNMFINLIAMIMTVFLLVKLRLRKATVATVGIGNAQMVEQNKNFKNANQLAVNVLLVSGVCLFLPNGLTGVGEMFGLTFYRKLGPIVSLGLVLSGVCNSLIYGMKHKEIRTSIFGRWRRHEHNQMTSSVHELHK